MILARIEPLSAAKVMGSIYALIGLVVGALFTLAALIGAFAATSEDPGTVWLAPLFGIGAIVIFPILYGCVAFVMALFVSFLYNLIAARVGGIRIVLGE